ncbi:MAG: hypothetical protein LBQ22_02675 [Bacteroidales bacterium]|jgi:hypothetical protein|nr:hypothetical protein [Bacteroidales bacterium]
MKTLKSLFIAVVAICSLQFTGCTKDEISIESEAAVTELKAELILLGASGE